MSESESDKGATAKAQEKAQELKEAIKKLDFRDRVVFLGSGGLSLLFFLPWYRVTITLLGTSDSQSWSGLHGAGWVGFIAACLGTVAGLANMGFVPLSGEMKSLAGKTTVQLGLAAAALLLGPVYFLSSFDEVRSDPLGMAKAGTTFFFWLAFLAAGAAAGCAGWKLAEERKKAAGTAA